MKVAESIGTTRVYGIDIVEEALQKAKKRGLVVYKSDLNERFPLENNSVDVVVSDQVIEHLHDLDNFVSEIYRVLRPEGYAVVSTENLSSWHNILALIRSEQPFSGPIPSSRFQIGWHPLHQENTCNPKVPMPEHDKVLAAKAFRQLFKMYDFIVTEFIGVGYLPFPGVLGRMFSSIDTNHSQFLIMKVKKQ